MQRIRGTLRVALNDAIRQQLLTVNPAAATARTRSSKVKRASATCCAVASTCRR